MVLLVDYGKILYSSVNKLKQNSDASLKARRIYIYIFCTRFISFTFDFCGLLSFVCHFKTIPETV